MPVPTQHRTVEWLATPRPVAEFTLASAAGPFTREQLHNGWHLLLFGYTRCPDICPTSLAELRLLAGVLQDLPLQVVFISIDPQRDTVEGLADYVAYFHRGFIGATGDSGNLRALADSIGVQFKLRAAGSSAAIAHSISLSLIGPGGKLRGRMRPGFAVDTAAREISKKVLASS